MNTKIQEYEISYIIKERVDDFELIPGEIIDSKGVVIVGCDNPRILSLVEDIAMRCGKDTQVVMNEINESLTLRGAVENCMQLESEIIAPKLPDLESYIDLKNMDDENNPPYRKLEFGKKKKKWN